MSRSGPRLRIGVSSCLLGREVRFDGGHTRNAFLCEQLEPFVEWVPVCPEVEVGMGIPRPALRLERGRDGPRLVEIKSRDDHTRAMQRWSRRRLAELGELDLSGYVLKKDSPSCGMQRVKVYDANRVPARDGRGIFAAALLEAFPDLPVEEEGRLNDPRLRENFIERLFAYRRLRELLAGRFARRALVEFHTAHKLQLLAHSPEQYRALGRLVAGAKRIAPAELRRRYRAGFMSALARLATPGRNTNVLQHMAGYVRDGLDAASRAELADLIDAYRRGRVPLVVPLTLLRHHVRRQQVEYLLDQVYLDPHPQELMLRNHV